MSLPFDRVNQEALAQAWRLLPDWLPGGQWSGEEWATFNPKREDHHPGSFSVNSATGLWKDFASDDGGGDLVSLYAWLQGIAQGESCIALARGFGIRLDAKPADNLAPAEPEWPRPILPVPREAPHLPKQVGEEGRWESRDAEGQLLLIRVRTANSTQGKAVKTWTWCQTGVATFAWNPKAPDAPRPLFGLDRLAHRPDARVLVVEGEKTACAAERLFPDWVAVTSGSSDSAKFSDWRALAGRHVTIWPDADDSGAGYALKVAGFLEGSATSVRLVALPPAIKEWVKPGKDKPGGWDLADMPPANVDLAAVLQAAKLVGESPEFESTPGSLGSNQGFPEGSVSSSRPKQSTEGKNGGSSTISPQPVLWPNPVDASYLLDEIKATIQTFIVCDPEVAVAATLWVSFTWFIDVVQVAPLAVITAPEPRCGKTQLLDLLGRLARRPLLASNISPAAVFRVIEACQPTLMIDEADSFLKDNEPLRGILNSGHTRQTAYVVRTVGDDHEPKKFSTWGAKALCGIGHLPRTLMDRAIVLELRRKLKHETVQPLRHAGSKLFERLASMLATFADSASEAIRKARPILPEELNDRAQDNWDPLLAIADYAGGDWPEVARRAALKLAGVEQEPTSNGVQLLIDIRKAFSAMRTNRITTFDLIAFLIADDLQAWHAFDHGRAITPAQIGQLLKPYRVKSKDIKVQGGSTLKGFTLDQFRDVFARYLDSPSGEGSEPQPATFQQNQGVLGSAPEGQGATTRYPQPADGSGVALSTGSRNQGATSEPALPLDCRGGADQTWEDGSHVAPAYYLPADPTESFQENLL